MRATTLTKKGQVTIPKEIRDQLGLKEKDRVLFLKREGVVILKPFKGNILDLKGSVMPRMRPEDFDAVRKLVKRGITARHTGKHGKVIR